VRSEPAGDLAASLAKHGHLNERGRAFNPKSVVSMLAS
jgi:hypothetical protein